MPVEHIYQHRDGGAGSSYWYGREGYARPSRSSQGWRDEHP